MSAKQKSIEGLRIAPVEGEEDIAQAFDCIAAAFGHQIKDGIWIQGNPGWDQPEGRQKAIGRMLEGWKTIGSDKKGNPNTTWLKATVPDTELGVERVVGLAIWAQTSSLDGWGDDPPSDSRRQKRAQEIYPNDEVERRYLVQVEASLHRRREQLVREKASTEQPAIMVLDLCIVDPTFQGNGIAKKLVQWGLDEAKRRGDLECTTEGSVMGRRVYEKFGFQQEGPEIQYTVDAEFADRSKPSNIFMRTRPSQ